MLQSALPSRATDALGGFWFARFGFTYGSSGFLDASEVRFFEIGLEERDTRWQR